MVAGEAMQHQYHVRSGMLKSSFINSQGDECVTGFYLPGEAVPVFATGGQQTHSVIALEETSVCAVHLSRHLTPDAKQVPIWQALFQHTQATTSQALGHQLNIRHPSAAARFAGFCVDLMQRLAVLQREQHHLPTPMTRTDIASYLGLTLESLSRVMSRMKRKQIIEASRSHINILQPERLQSLAAHLH